MGMYRIKITNKNKNTIGKILIENKVMYKNRFITQIMWNKMLNIAE